MAYLIEKHSLSSPVILVALQYFSEDGVDPRIFESFESPRSSGLIISTPQVPSECIVLPRELVSLAEDSKWKGRAILLAADGECSTLLGKSEIVRLLTHHRVVDLTTSCKGLGEFPKRRRVRRLVRRVADLKPSDVLIAIGVRAVPLANAFAQEVLKGPGKLHLPTLVCTRFRVPPQDVVEAQACLAKRLAADAFPRPISTNISHTYLPLDLPGWLEYSTRRGNVLLVDDYTASGSMLTAVKRALAEFGRSDNKDWKLSSERIATMTMAHRATDVPGRDRDNSITTFKGIAVRSLFRRSGREVKFPWPRH